MIDPKNQHELVLHTLCEHAKEPFNLGFSAEYWMTRYKTYKFSTRLHELERKLSVKLCDRKLTDFTNRFGHKSKYMTYRPIYTTDIYISLLEKLRSKEVNDLPDFVKFA
jgi:hypothetical protein